MSRRIPLPATPIVTALAVVGLAALGCEEGPQAPTPEPGPPALLSIVSGNEQTGVVGQALGDPLVVRVTDEDSLPIEGQLVNFVVTSGGGSVFAGAALTNADGLAQELWTLGTDASLAQTVEVRAVDPVSGDPLVFATFHGDAVHDEPAQTTPIGDGQSGDAGRALADSVAVLVADQYGNPVPAVEVAWAVLAGGGSLPAATHTDSAGVARAQWTLGPRLDVTHLASATAAPLAPDTLSATATLPSDAQLVLISGDDQTDTVANVLDDSLVVQVQLADGTPLPGATVSWSIIAGGGVVAPVAGSSDEQGFAAAVWTLDTLATSGYEARALIEGGAAEVRFSATATPGVPHRITTNGAAQNGSVGEPMPDSSVAVVYDRYWNAVPGVEVAWSAPDSGASVDPATSVSGPNGRARTQWTAGYVEGVQILWASIGVDSVDFGAHVDAGPPASIRVDEDTVRLDAIGAGRGLAVQAYDQFGNAVPHTAPRTFATTDSSVFRFSAQTPNRVIATGNGSAWAVVTAGSLIDSALVIVDQLAAAIELTLAANTIDIGDTIGSTAVVRDANGHVIPDASVTYSSSDTTIARVFDDGRVAGMARGYVSIFAHSDTISRYYNLTVLRPDTIKPTLTIVEPDDYDVVHGDLHLLIECTDDDPLGCAQIEVIRPGRRRGTVIARGTSSIDTTVSLPVGGPHTLEIVARDRHDRVRRRTIQIFVEPAENAAFLDPVQTVAGRIMAADAERMVVLDSSATEHVLRLIDRLSGDTVGAFENPALANVDRNVAMTPLGAFFIHVRQPAVSLYEWRGNSLIDHGRYVNLEVENGFAIWGYWPVTTRYDIIAGTSMQVGADSVVSNPDLAPNGDVVYHITGPYEIYRWRAGVETQITTDPDTATWNASAVSDGSAIVYTNTTPCCTNMQRRLMLWTDTGTVEIAGPADQNHDYDIGNGWVAFRDPAVGGTVWSRSPTGVLEQVTTFSASVESVGPTGGVFVHVGTTRYYWDPTVGGDARRVSTNGRPLWIDGEPYVAIGNTLFAIQL